MIKKLEKVAIYEGTTDQERLYILRKLRQVVDKINEIIDHLPQEKEDIYITNFQDKVHHFKGCQCVVCKGFEPAREVPDIRPILEKIFKSDDPEFDMEHIEPRIEKAVQEISALYRKEIL